MLANRVGMALFVVALSGKLARAFLAGPVIAPDSQRFVDLASALISPSVTPLIAPGAPVFYGFYATMLAILWTTSGSLQTGFELLVLLQAVASAASVYVLFRTLLWLSGGRWMLAFTLAGAFLLNPDILLWDPVVTADSLNLSLLVAATSLLAGRLGAAPGRALVDGLHY